MEDWRLRLYERLGRNGFEDFEITPELLTAWHGYIDCSYSNHPGPLCTADAVVFLDGDPYCAEHANQILDEVEAAEAEALEQLRSGLAACGVEFRDAHPGDPCNTRGDGSCGRQAVVIIEGVPRCLLHAKVVLNRKQTR